MRRNDAIRAPGWASKVIDSASLPLSGFVWEDEGASSQCQPDPVHQGWTQNLPVANVSTHPDYRARALRET